MSGGRNVVFTFSTESYDNAVEREFCRPPDQTLLALARAPEVERLFAVDPWRSAPVDVYRRRGLRTRETVEVAGREVVRVRPRRLRLRDPLELSAARAAYSAYGERIGRALAADAGDRGASALVTYHPFVAAWCRPRWASHTVYVGQDDFTFSTRLAEYRPLFEQAYHDMRRHDVTTFAVSEELAGRIDPGRTIVVANGVDDARWRPVPPLPSELARLPRPIAVYAGSMERRIDVRLLEATSSLVGTVLLVGPIFDATLEEAVGRIPNVHCTGVLKQDDLVAHIYHSDVGLLPHHETGMTRAMSPLKLYEYLAGGLPVVAVDLPPVRGVHEAVRLSSSPDDWSGLLREALNAGRLQEHERLAFLSTVSWTARQAPVVAAALGAR